MIRAKKSNGKLTAGEWIESDGGVVERGRSEGCVQRGCKYIVLREKTIGDDR